LTIEVPNTINVVREGEQFSRKRGGLGKYIDNKLAAYELILSHIFHSIQETQCDWNKNIFGERSLGN
jgi:hypothetical protein